MYYCSSLEKAFEDYLDDWNTSNNEVGKKLCLQWMECSKNLSIIEIIRVKIGRHLMKNCGKKDRFRKQGKIWWNFI